MAVKKPRDIPVTREEVYEWLQEFEGQQRSTKKMKDHLTKKLKEKGLDETEVDTTEMESHGSTVPLVEMILKDLDSYG